MLTNDLTHGFAVDNLAMDDTEDVERPRSGSVPAVQFADDSDRDSDKEVSEIISYQKKLLMNITLNYSNVQGRIQDFS